ncbi:hypothetical protein BC831DRAFT_551615 [Entophlyctis helioformis]|nr:hypothetical protein BC831DRAFT_551615 [Entophlyctis helioformis]
MATSTSVATATSLPFRASTPQPAALPAGHAHTVAGQLLLRPQQQHPQQHQHHHGHVGSVSAIAVSSGDTAPSAGLVTAADSESFVSPALTLAAGPSAAVAGIGSSSVSGNSNINTLSTTVSTTISSLHGSSSSNTAGTSNNNNNTVTELGHYQLPATTRSRSSAVIILHPPFPRPVRIIPDVLPDIFGFLQDSSATLHSCALVSTTWHAVALQFLYTSPQLRTVRSLRKLLATLALHPSLCHWIRRLDLSHIRTTILANDLARLLGMLPRVRQLDLSFCRELRDNHVHLLVAHCRPLALAELRLSANRHVTDTSLQELLRHSGPSLRGLCIDECHGVTDRTLQVVAAECTGLQALKLASTATAVTDDGLAALAFPLGTPRCTALRSLQLYDCPALTDASLALLAQACPALASLELFRLPNVSDAALFAMAKHAPLSSLCVGEMPLITDAALCTLGRHCDMRSLTVCHCENITDRGVVEMVRHSPNLRFVDLGLLGDITLVSLVATAQCCPHLTDLVVSGNLHAEAIPTRAVMDVVRAMPRLESLTVFHSRDITLDDAETLARTCPHIRSLFIRQCVHIVPPMADGFCKRFRMQLVVE